MRVILASASPRRSVLLREMGVKFEVVASRAEELHDESRSAARLCEINAERKAAEVAEKFPDAVVIGADTLVALDGRIFGKPANLEIARGMLRELSGKTHEVVTGVCLVRKTIGKTSLFYDLTRVTFCELSGEKIDEYLREVEVLDKAGAYGIQEHGELIVERIEGSFRNVMGLPVERLAREFTAWGIDYHQASSNAAHRGSMR